MHEIPLEGVPVGARALVRRLTSPPGIRRRLLDMGLTAGVPLTCLFESPCGDMRAYLVRGAVIALRAEVARTIFVEAV